MTFMPFFTITFGAFLCALVGAVIADWNAYRKLSKRGWHDLVADLGKVNLPGVTAVAVDYLTPCRDQLTLEADEIWQMVGGCEGLRKMRQNAEIMLALAAHAQRWNFDEAVVVTERMRQEAVELRRAVRCVEIGMIPARFLRRFRITIPLRAQEASASYYLMRQRLLFLYEVSHAGLYPKLATAL